MAKWLIAVVSAIAGTCCVVLVASCTTFSTDPATTPDASIDSPSTPSDSSVPTPDVVVDAAPPPSCKAQLCEDFESTEWAKNWTKVGAGDLDVRVANGGRALELFLPVNEPVIFVRSIGTFQHVKLTFTMKVLERGDGEIDFVNIVDGAQIGASGLHLVHTNGLFGVQPSGGNPKAVAAKLSDPTVVELSLDLVTRTYGYTIGGELVSAEPLPAAFITTKKTLYLSLGAAYAMAIQKQWRVRFDDIVVEAN